MIASDYTVTPAHVTNAYNFDTGTVVDQVRLLQGEVVEMVAPDSPKSVSKTWNEYVVEVQVRTRGGSVHTRFYGCVVASGFGATADRTRHTLRVRSNENASDGAKVLILCVNGYATKPIIIGGLPDQGEDAVSDTDISGRALEYEFNGVKFSVSDDGAMTLAWAGATDINGDAVADKPVAEFKVEADGSVVVSASDSNQSLRFDVGDNTWTLNTPGDSKIKSAKLLVGAATDAMVMGTTYRNSESQENTQIMAALTAAAASLTAAGSGLAAVAASHLVPVVGPITASPALAAAAAAIVSAATSITQAVTAISTFEANALTYLSKNKLD